MPSARFTKIPPPPPTYKYLPVMPMSMTWHQHVTPQARPDLKHTMSNAMLSTGSHGGLISHAYYWLLCLLLYIRIYLRISDFKILGKQNVSLTRISRKVRASVSEILIGLPYSSPESTLSPQLLFVTMERTRFGPMHSLWFLQYFSFNFPHTDRTVGACFPVYGMSAARKWHNACIALMCDVLHHYDRCVM